VTEAERNLVRQDLERNTERGFVICVFPRGLLGRFSVGRWDGRNILHDWEQ